MTETAWLVEMQGPKWFRYTTYGFGFTDDANQAHRFPTKEEATTARDNIAEVIADATGAICPNLTVTEHQWG